MQKINCSRRCQNWATAASSDELRTGFEKHLEQTKIHIQRLVGMEGLVKEGSEVMEEGFEDALLDAGLICAARRVEHYEMAAYGAACEIAKVLGETQHESLLKKTLAEEKQADEKHSDLANEITSQAKEDKSDEQRDSLRAGKKKQKHAA